MVEGDNAIIASMEGFQPLQSLRRTVQYRFQDVLKQRFFHDRISVTVLTLALIINVGSLIDLSLKLRPTDSQVPVHFSSFTLFDQLGPWYFPLEIAFVTLIISLINAIFAYRSFTRSRLASFFLLLTAFVVAIFGFIIAQAFGAVH
jgi:hypothetical protein